MTGDRGQALVLAVLALSIAAVTIVGLRAAQDRILSDAQERRAGEAAVEAAGAAIADAEVLFFASLREDADRPRLALPTRAEIDALISDPILAGRARDAADALAAANGGAPVSDISIRSTGSAIEVTLVLGRQRQRAAIESRCCRP